MKTHKDLVKVDDRKLVVSHDTIQVVLDDVVSVQHRGLGLASVRLVGP